MSEEHLTVAGLRRIAKKLREAEKARLCDFCEKPMGEAGMGAILRLKPLTEGEVPDWRVVCHRCYEAWPRV